GGSLQTMAPQATTASVVGDLRALVPSLERWLRAVNKGSHRGGHATRRVHWRAQHADRGGQDPARGRRDVHRVSGSYGLAQSPLSSLALGVGACPRVAVALAGVRFLGRAQTSEMSL